MEELTGRVASSGHRDSRPTPPKSPEKPSAVPPPPRDSDKAPDEIIALRPREEGCEELLQHFPLGSNANTPESVVYRVGSEADDSGLLTPGQAQLNSASLSRGLGESGSSFREEVTPSHLSPDHRISMLRSAGTGDV